MNRWQFATGRHHVVVVGAGFGGLEVVKHLNGAAVDITLIDQRNHHLFQPLLYQVATASLMRPRSLGPFENFITDERFSRYLERQLASTSMLESWGLATAA